MSCNERGHRAVAGLEAEVPLQKLATACFFHFFFRRLCECTGFLSEFQNEDGRHVVDFGLRAGMVRCKEAALGVFDRYKVLTSTTAVVG